MNINILKMMCMTKNDVGTNAGAIWMLLSRKEKMTIREIGELTNCKDTFIYLVLGWLLREDKICFVDKNGILYAQLKSSFVETYY